MRRDIERFSQIAQSDRPMIILCDELDGLAVKLAVALIVMCLQRTQHVHQPLSDLILHLPARIFFLEDLLLCPFRPGQLQPILFGIIIQLGQDLFHHSIPAVDIHGRKRLIQIVNDHGDLRLFQIRKQLFYAFPDKGISLFLVCLPKAQLRHGIVERNMEAGDLILLRSPGIGDARSLQQRPGQVLQPIAFFHVHGHRGKDI